MPKLRSCPYIELCQAAINMVYADFEAEGASIVLAATTADNATASKVEASHIAEETVINYLDRAAKNAQYRIIGDQACQGCVLAD